MNKAYFIGWRALERARSRREYFLGVAVWLALVFLAGLAPDF